MLLRIAWRNIWRNKRRSIIVIASIVIGVIAIVFDDALSIGMVTQIFENQLGSYVSFIQIHAKGFNDNKVVQNAITDPASVDRVISRNPEVQSFCRRVVTYGLVSSALNSSGAAIIGVEPDNEANVTIIKRSIVEGRYLDGKRHEVVMGKRLAEKLGVGLGDKVVGMASTTNGRVGTDLFRIVGMYETVRSEFDKSYLFISLNDAQNMLEMGNSVSEFAMITFDRNRVEDVKHELATSLGGEFEVLSYADLIPLMVSQMEIYKESLYIIYVIVGLALIFGIINTMLMSVFERIREFGVLMAIGMKNSRLFSMVLTEAALIGVLGSVLGIGIGCAMCLPLSIHGIDLSRFSESLTAFGSGAVIYPILTLSTVIEMLLVIPFTAVLGSVYPALKAVRLVPTNAIRHL